MKDNNGEGPCVLVSSVCIGMPLCNCIGMHVCVLLVVKVGGWRETQTQIDKSRA